MPNTIQIELTQAGPTTSKAAIRGHEALVDRPEAKGGADRGPMGGEYLLTGLGGCFLSNLLAAIRAREAPVSNVKARVIATLAEAPPRFSAIHLQVEADTEDRELLEKLVTIAERGCICANTLRNGVDLTVEVL